MAVPIHLVSGFLGAGKTTVIRGLLSRRGQSERIAVVLNDFGELPIDAALLEGGSLTELQGGCVCCTAPAGFVAAVGRLLDEVRPDRIVVEPTGLADAADLIDTIRRAPWASRVVLGPVVVVIDPQLLWDQPHNEVLAHQLAAGAVWVANRVDLASEEALVALRARAAAAWPSPELVETSFGVLPEALFSGQPGESVARAAHDHDHDHDHGGYHDESGAAGPEVVFSAAGLRALWAGAPGLVRAKGLFRTDEGWLRLDVAGGRVHEERVAWRTDSRWLLVHSSETPGEPLSQATVACVVAQGPEAGIVEVARRDGTVLRFDRARLMAQEGAGLDLGSVVPGKAGSGLRLGPWLASAGLDPDAMVVVAALDGLVTPAVPLSSLRDGLLVYGLGDAPLTSAQGGPFRMILPPGAASPCANVKGVVRIVEK